MKVDKEEEVLRLRKEELQQAEAALVSAAEECGRASGRLETAKVENANVPAAWKNVVALAGEAERLEYARRAAAARLEAAQEAHRKADVDAASALLKMRAPSVTSAAFHRIAEEIVTEAVKLRRATNALRAKAYRAAEDYAKAREDALALATRAGTKIDTYALPSVRVLNEMPERQHVAMTEADALVARVLHLAQRTIGEVLSDGASGDGPGGPYAPALAWITPIPPHDAQVGGDRCEWEEEDDHHNYHARLVIRHVRGYFAPPAPRPTTPPETTLPAEAPVA